VALKEGWPAQDAPVGVTARAGDARKASIGDPSQIPSGWLLVRLIPFLK
jgi:hypothetical protein